MNEKQKCHSCKNERDEINAKTGKFYSRCSKCLERKRKWESDRKSSGKCCDCGKTSDGKTRCLKCCRKVKARLKEQGKCQSCGGAKHNSRSLCKKCVIKNIATKGLQDRSRWTELSELYESQNGCCAVTGKSIELGTGDASLDHIIPTSRGGGNELGNLRWVHITVNRMKNDMLDSEFLEWLDIVRTGLSGVLYGTTTLSEGTTR
jgi:hypothetical protein